MNPMKPHWGSSPRKLQVTSKMNIYSLLLFNWNEELSLCSQHDIPVFNENTQTEKTEICWYSAARTVDWLDVSLLCCWQTPCFTFDLCLPSLLCPSFLPQLQEPRSGPHKIRTRTHTLGRRCTVAPTDSTHTSEQLFQTERSHWATFHGLAANLRVGSTVGT